MEMITRKPKWEGKRRHFKKCFSLLMMINREDELLQFLEQMGLTARQDYRLALTYKTHWQPFYDVLLSFRDANNAVLFKMSWDVCDISAITKIVIPRIRGVMPNIIAQDILSVQPMTGTMDKVFSLGTSHAPNQPPTSPSDSL